MKIDRQIPRAILRAGVVIGTAVLLAGSPVPARGGEAPVSFNRDVRPILSEHCFSCHGPDSGSRKAGLRLDLKTSATSPIKSGAIAAVAGDLDASELYQRVTAEDESDRMPPRSGKRINAAQVETLRRWIAQGAVWEEHWSLIPPKRPSPPNVKNHVWVRNAVDQFLLARMEARGLAPSPEADRVTLIRRLTGDLIGLPPSPEEVDAFVADPRPDAYERLVERLLASPHYGERMAVSWLDLVRYADTVGYHSDVERSISLYRDYVIDAFNEDRPFDQFTTEQLAGDLLPGSTTWQQVASAYNMLGMTTEEGGAQPKEYLAKYSADRVRNFASVWLGATLACAECHDHKYDPYSTREFYALAAFFADLKQEGHGTPKPTLKITELDGTIRSTIVSIPGPPRVTRVLRRGDWMDESGEVVSPAVPGSLGPLDVPSGHRATRLDLARWLLSPAHPRTARVVVNRLWKMSFGTGLSDTLDDFGSQGEWPTHPELLDWLAVEFRERGWSFKQMVRLLVTSSAYQQSSRPRDDLASADPSNRLHARQSAFRREAEFIRDNALAVSGLLVRGVGGKSVRPYQPDGYWRFLNFPQREYVPSDGRDQYRRGVYTHWQRTLLHPALLAFDAPSREACAASRPASNTPQAALALLNDPSQVEAARALAERVLREGGPDDDQRLTWVWRLVLSRHPTPEERAVLTRLLSKHRREYTEDRAAAPALLKVGQQPTDRALNPAELAAWTSVARAILNLDETITRE
jgi:hypothetical protein